MTGRAEDEDFVEVFRVLDRGAAEMVIDEVLTPAGIPAAVHNRSSTALPAPASEMGGFYIAVAKSRAAQAIDALREADEGGILPDGELAEA